MKYAVVSINNEFVKVFTDKTDVARQIGVSHQTVTNWFLKGNMFYYKGYFVFSDVEHIKSSRHSGKNRNNLFQSNYTA